MLGFWNRRWSFAWPTPSTARPDSVQTAMRSAEACCPLGVLAVSRSIVAHPCRTMLLKWWEIEITAACLCLSACTYLMEVWFPVLWNRDSWSAEEGLQSLPEGVRRFVGFCKINADHLFHAWRWDLQHPGGRVETRLQLWHSWQTLQKPLRAQSGKTACISEKADKRLHCERRLQLTAATGKIASMIRFCNVCSQGPFPLPTFSSSSGFP